MKGTASLQQLRFDFFPLIFSFFFLIAHEMKVAMSTVVIAVESAAGYPDKVNRFLER